MSEYKDFPWRPRMVAFNPWNCHTYTLLREAELTSGWWTAWRHDGDGDVMHGRLDQCQPVETDPATIGALLGAVREAYGIDVSPVYGFDNVTDSWRWTLRTGQAMPAGLSMLSAPTEFGLLMVAWAARPVSG